jgi:hypothetical protein
MWQASQNKDIIEAKTEWFMPEIYSFHGNTWRADEYRYPSFCKYFKEPLVRAKYSTDGSGLLVIACNPYNQGVEQIRIREPQAERQAAFELIGDYPVVKRFSIRRR